MTDLGALEKANSIAYGVNDASVIVGCSGDDAVRWVNKRIENLNHLIDRRSGWHLTVCTRDQSRRHHRGRGHAWWRELAVPP